jgi:hypothetical protein
LAPEGTPARRANERFNAFVEDAARGLVVYHDHFVERHGGVAVFHVQDQEELRCLSDPGPLDGWEISLHSLTFSLTAVGFAAQVDFTLDRYRGTSLAELAAAEPPDKRYWWQDSEPKRG